MPDFDGYPATVTDLKKFAFTCPALKEKHLVVLAWSVRCDFHLGITSELIDELLCHLTHSEAFGTKEAGRECHPVDLVAFIEINPGAGFLTFDQVCPFGEIFEAENRLPPLDRVALFFGSGFKLSRAVRYREPAKAAVG